MGQQWPTAGTEALAAAVLGGVVCGLRPLGGGLRPLALSLEPIALAQRLQNPGLGCLRERAQPQPSAENWIKDLLSMTLPSEQDPVFPTASLSHQGACTSLLLPCIRAQTE